MDLSLLVSINCITYNHEEYIVDALEGFLMQETNFSFEILIGEDCSTDNTRKIVDEYVKQYPGQIRLITSAQNVGMEKNALRVFEQSQGKYIAECEGDDYWTNPFKLQKQVDYMENNPECTLCFHAAEIVVASKKATGRKVKPYFEDQQASMEDIILGGGAFCATASLVYPRKLMSNPPSFFKTAHVGDYPTQLFLANKGYAYYIDECMSAYRTGVTGSWTNQMNSGKNIRGKMIEVNEGDIRILTGFNEYTNLKYAKLIDSIVIKKEFILLTLRKQLNDRKNVKYENYIKNLNKKERLKLWLLYYHPNLYVKLAGIKGYGIGKKLIN